MPISASCEKMSGARGEQGAVGDRIFRLPLASVLKRPRGRILGFGWSMAERDTSATSGSIAVSWREAAKARLGDEMAEASSSTTAADDAEEFDPTPFGLYYGQLFHQQNMLQDSIRTGTYQTALTSNPTSLAGKVVLDVGTGTGLLAFFAVQAGASKVYAVEASDMADHARALVQGNNMGDRIEVRTRMGRGRRARARGAMF